jgi:hypothetical protein
MAVQSAYKGGEFRSKLVQSELELAVESQFSVGVSHWTFVVEEELEVSQ